METHRIATLDELREVATAVLELCTRRHGFHIITLSGNLGAGKTAFVKELAKVLKIESEITSPTFVIMKSYSIPDHSTFTTLTHIDAYRIESDDEMMVLGFDTLTHTGSKLICIEWPEKIETILPHDCVRVRIHINPDNTRSISYGI